MERISVDTSQERFRKRLGIDRHPRPASDKELEDAIQTGIQDATTRQLTARQLKDRANTVSSWIESNRDSLHLSQKEEETFRTYKKEIHKKFFDARYSIINKIEHTQSLRNNCYEYFEFGQIFQDPVERFYFAKDIRPLTKDEIHGKNEHFDNYYDIEVIGEKAKSFHSWEFETNRHKLRIEITVYNKEGNENPPYTNAVNLDNYGIEGWDNMRIYDKLGLERMHMSDIKYQTLRKALEWLKNTNNPDFQQYKNLSIDNFQPYSLSGNDVTGETKATVFQAIEEYTRRKQDANQSLTEEEKKEIFFFPSDSNEFKQIAFETILGKEKLFFLRNYFPDRRCTGVRLITEKGREWPQLRIMEYVLEEKK